MLSPAVYRLYSALSLYLAYVCFLKRSSPNRLIRFFSRQAIRAMLHPERYGPRARNNRGGVGQSRARGLTRAILDTFPVVKFGNNTADETVAKPVSQQNPSQDVEAQNHANSVLELNELEDTRVEGQDFIQPINTPRAQPIVETPHHDSVAESSRRRPRILPHRSRSTTANIETRPDPGEGSSRREPAQTDVIPAAMGRDTCPICIMDFEEGDDLRVLPCEGKHRFHQSCVDPWLLQLSSSCPICRQGEWS